MKVMMTAAPHRLRAALAPLQALTMRTTLLLARLGTRQDLLSWTFEKSSPWPTSGGGWLQDQGSQCLKCFSNFWTKTGQYSWHLMITGPKRPKVQKISLISVWMIPPVTPSLVRKRSPAERRRKVKEKGRRVISLCPHTVVEPRVGDTQIQIFGIPNTNPAVYRAIWCYLQSLRYM